MNIQYDNIKNTPIEIQKRVEVLATKLHEVHVSRAEAADIVRAHGFAVHVGGRHVAIHNEDAEGRITGERIAMITESDKSNPNFKDWN